MKAKISGIQKHKEGDPFYLTLWLDLPDRSQVMTKLTKDHLKNLIQRNKLPKHVEVGLTVNVCERKGRVRSLYYIYGYEVENE